MDVVAEERHVYRHVSFHFLLLKYLTFIRSKIASKSYNSISLIIDIALVGVSHSTPSLSSPPFPFSAEVDAVRDLLISWSNLSPSKVSPTPLITNELSLTNSLSLSPLFSTNKSSPLSHTTPSSTPLSNKSSVSSSQSSNSSSRSLSSSDTQTKSMSFQMNSFFFSLNFNSANELPWLYPCAKLTPIQNDYHGISLFFLRIDSFS
jgi:hypothetical protein